MHFLQSLTPEYLAERNMNFILLNQHRLPPAQQSRYRALLIPREIMISYAQAGEFYEQRA